MISLQRLPALPWLVLVSILTSLAADTATAQNRFALAPAYPLGGSAIHPVAADFDGDGRADVLSIVVYNLGNTEHRELVLARATAEGAYPKPTVLFQLPEAAQGFLVAGDFNEDGKQDFALMLPATGGVAIDVYLGRGDGTFSAQQPALLLLNTPEEVSGYGIPTALVAGRVTRSGHTDLVVGVSTSAGGEAYETGVIHVLPGRGDGTFASPKATVTAVNPAVVALGDLNIDGTQDLAIDGVVSVQILLGNGDGSFRVLAPVVLPPNIVHPYLNELSYRDILVSDITGDGKPDLILANTGDDPAAGDIRSVFVLEGYGDGTFHSQGIYYDAGNSGTSLALGDLNRDGYPDLVVANGYSSTVAVRFGSSKGPSAVWTAKYAVSAYFGSGTVLIADANGDGRQDVLYFSSAHVQVLMNTGGGNLRAPRATDIQSFSAGLQASDLNYDGFADLALIGEFHRSPYVFDITHELYLALGGPTESLNAIDTGIPAESAASEPSGPHFVALGYFNQDGNLDIASDGGVSFNNGHAQFTTHSAEPPNLGKSPHSTADYNTVTGDLNHDGKADLVSAGATTVMVSLGNGDGTFRNPVEYSLGGTDANAVMLRDINQDGNPDAITANYGSSTVSVFLGNGDGTFKAPLDFAVTKNPLVLTTGDFNGDGKIDIAVASATSVSILMGDGRGKFMAGNELTGVGRAMDGIVSSDLRGNGVFDLILLDQDTYSTNLADQPTNSVYVLYGSGHGTFAAPVSYAIGDAPAAIVAGDFNGDGAPDVAVSLSSATAVPIFYNQGGTRITLTSSAATVPAGQTVTFRATVAASLPGVGSPNGTVGFKQGTVTLGRIPLRNGAATFSTAALNKGSHTISAVYYGNNSFNPHISRAVGVTVR